MDKIEKVRTFLNSRNPELKIIVLEEDTSTSYLAAQALGTEVGQIAKSILFKTKNDDYLLIVSAGDVKIDNKAVKELVGSRVRMANAEEVEQVTKMLEGQINSLSNVKKIESYSMSGSSIMLISFNWGTDMSSAINDIREKTSLIEKYLPSGVEKPMVVKMDVNMMPIIQTGVEAKGDMSLAELQSIAEDEIKPRLERIPEVASVIITGGQERQVKVEVDPVKLESYGLTLTQVNQLLQAENFNMSSGQVKTGPRKYYVRNLQEFESIDDIKDVNIITATGNSIRLGDIAAVTDGYKDDNQITRLNGGAAADSEVYADDFLYDLQKDPFELRNVVADPAYRAARDEMAALLLREMRRAGEREPRLLRAGEECPQQHA